MSQDLELYCRKDPAYVIRAIARQANHQDRGGTFCLEGKGWQVALYPAATIEAEDVPPFLTDDPSGITHLLEVSIEGQPNWLARRKAMGLFKQIALASNGVFYNKYNGKITTVDGTRQVDVVPAILINKEMRLQWWFEDVDKFYNGGYVRFFETIEREWPEALPRRYGRHEPPEFNLAKEGRDHFLAFFQEHLRAGMVWRATEPVRSMRCIVPASAGGSWHGYQCGNITTDTSVSVFRDQSMRERLPSLLASIGLETGAFYSEIRVGESIAKPWSWKGIPNQQVVASMIGPPYSSFGRITLLAQNVWRKDFTYVRMRTQWNL